MLLSSLVLTVFASPIFADFTVPPLTAPVVDAARALNEETVRSLNRVLRDVKERRGVQVQVLVVESLGGRPIEEASLRVVEAWKLGSATQDDGILLMVSMGERRVRIEVGQGIEGVLPDAIASRIVRNVIVPRFKEGDPDRAVSSGVYAILHYALGEAGENVAQDVEAGKVELGKLFLLLLIAAFFIPFFHRASRLSGGRGGGYWGGGFGGGGFGGGGGWSGGGGGFSGGGASGGW